MKIKVTDRELRVLGALRTRWNTTRSRWTTPKAMLADRLIEPETTVAVIHLDAARLARKGLIDKTTMGGTVCYALNRAGADLLDGLRAR